MLVWVWLNFFGEFNFVWFSNFIKLNPWIELDWVWLSLIAFDWNLRCVQLGSIYYAGCATWLWHRSNSRSTSCFCGVKQNSSIILIYYVNTSEISGFSLLRKNHIFIVRNEDTIFIFHVWGYWCRHVYYKDHHCYGYIIP